MIYLWAPLLLIGWLNNLSIAIIPARGGSKRIPRKNIKLFYGKPIISYAIETALSSKIFDRVIVTTDDIEIASISREYGAEVPALRNSDLANDWATTLDVMQDQVKKLMNEIETETKICCIYPTTPFLEAGYLREGEIKIKSNNWDYVIAISRNPTPIFRAFNLDKSSKTSMVFPEHEFTRTQDLPISFHDAGQFYWGLAQSWIEKKPIFSSNTTVVEIPRSLDIDIDVVEDWELAEKLFDFYKRRVNNG